VNKSTTILWKYLAAAACVAVIVLFFQNMNQKKALTDCARENIKLIESQKVVTQLAYKLDILRRADTKPIEMKGLDIAPNAKVVVYWNAKEKATLLSIQNLPEPPKGKQYQLWAIVDKNPVNAGIFTYDVTAVQPMKGFENAEAFAVTLEPEGGSAVPTMDNMYVLGTVL
jgi:anti-sigma-K factor RskA